jgi:hypothetical protein
MNMCIRTLTIAILVFVLCAATIMAQSTSGSITGTVVDPQEAAIPNATVTVTEEGRSYNLTATTDGEGRFVFPIVPPGTYTVSVEAGGFKKQERKGVALVSNDRLTLGNLVLEIGAPSEVVNVTSEATLVQADSGERSFGIQGEQIRNLGVKTRSYINLATLAPGVVANGAGDGNSNTSSNLSVNGVRTNSNNVQIDGITSVDTGNNAELSRIPLDSVGEFKLITSTGQAEYGRSTGAQIIAVTRHGERDFHGSFYYYRRHTGLNANTFDNNRNNRARPISDQEDIGYTIGGPIYIPGFFNKDKKRLFFFVNQEWTPRITPNGINRVRVPTALERTGDFSQSRDSNGALFNFIHDPDIPITPTVRCERTPTNPNLNISYQGACYADDGVLGRIPSSDLYAQGLRLLSLYPLPNHTQLAGENYNFEEQISNDTKERNDTVRIDYNINDNWRLYGRMLNNYSVNTNPFSGTFGFILGGNIGEWGWKNDTPRLSFAGTLNGSLNSTTAVEFTYGFSRNAIDGRPNTDVYTFASSGLSGLPRIFPDATQEDLLPQFSFNGGPLNSTPSYRVRNGPFVNSNRTDNIAGSLSKVWGDHVSKFGGVFERGIKNQTNRVSFNGEISFSPDINNPFDTNQGFANAATGVFQNYTQASAGSTGKYLYHNYEFYAQDNWKITSRLTLDYGMRFSWLPPTRDTSGAASNFDPSLYNPANAPRLFAPGCLNQAIPVAGATFSNTTNCTRVAYDPMTLSVGTTLIGGGAPGTGGNSLVGIFIGKIIPGTGDRANGLVPAGTEALTEDQGLLFAPRFGFAYDLTGNHNLILRGGFGIFYDRSQGNLVFDYNENPPTTTTTRFDFGRLQSLGGAGTVANLTPQFIRAIEQDAKIPSVNSYNIGIQYKLPFDTVLDVAYVGSQSHHLPHVRPINETPFGSAWLAANQDPTKAAPTPTSVPGVSALPPDFYRPFKGFGGINFIEFRENSDYNSLQIGANRRFSKGLVLAANYTLGRANGITTADDGQARIDEKFYLDYGRLGFDRTHNFNLTWVYEIPWLTKNRYLGLITNGWQFSGIYRYQSGEPERVQCNVDGRSSQNITGSSSSTAIGSCIVNGSINEGFTRTPFQYFNVNALQALPDGATGDLLELRRETFTAQAPPINNFDLSLSKKFFIWEKLNIETRLDAFNALNHPQGAFLNFFEGSAFDNTAARLVRGDSIGNALTKRTGYGAFFAYRDERRMQLMLRVSF